ncbi:unnamed protein product [Paramecium sonneborni]|uniref:Uncharacterized protein n=1 Tax=Paramecium sonneborni TaxID=65129 RepID=A0A8S1Q5J1_9CILI|nr:unnamed protein product [Paramecium sonneborni]
MILQEKYQEINHLTQQNMDQNILNVKHKEKNLYLRANIIQQRGKHQTEYINHKSIRKSSRRENSCKRI